MLQVPDFELAPNPTELIFLVDCSGSMAGSLIKAAKEALLHLLASLPSTCFFNVWKFGSMYESCWPSSLACTTQSRELAETWVRGLEANMGGTELMRPLQAIFERPVAVGCYRQVFVLTDGAVSNTEAVIALVRRHAIQSRVFSIGIGATVSRALVEGMARAAGTFAPE